MATRDELKQFFETGDTPTAAQFAALIDAFIHQQDDRAQVSESGLGLGITNPKNRLDVLGAVGIGVGVAGEQSAPMNGLRVAGISHLEGGLQVGAGHAVQEISNDPTLAANSATALPTQQAVRQYLDELLVGSVSAFATDTAPLGWLACDGRALLRAQYPKLFERIGIRFGAGDGSTTFNLPDLRGEFVRGWDRSRGVDEGRTLGTSQSHMLQGHTHHEQGNGHYHWGWHEADHVPVLGSGYLGGHLNAFSSSLGRNQRTEFARVSLGDPAATSHGPTAVGPETRPRNVALLYCIKH